MVGKLRASVVHERAVVSSGSSHGGPLAVVPALHVVARPDRGSSAGTQAHRSYLWEEAAEEREKSVGTQAHRSFLWEEAAVEGEELDSRIWA